MATEEKQTKAARNQSLFREVNERVRTVSIDLPHVELVGFVCECANTECLETMELTLPEYEAVRLVPTHFPVRPGHVPPDVEHVVGRHDRYFVVEKFGEAGNVAVREWQDEF